MRQKYMISQNGKQSNLTIKEYAVVNKDLKKVDTSLLRDDHYTFLFEENYDGPMIKRSIAEGEDAVLRALRTPSMFPIKPFAAKMVESVIKLYKSKGKDSVTLFFDDVDLVIEEAEAV